MKRYKAIATDGSEYLDFEFDATDDMHAAIVARVVMVRRWKSLADLIDISTPNHRAVDLTAPQVEPKR